MESYRRLCLRLGAAMLCHFVLINAVMVTVLSLVDALSYDLDYRTYNLIYQLLYAALYLASFMLPVAFFRVLDHDEPPQPMGMAPTLTWRTVPMIFAVLGVNLPCAYLNSLFMELLESMGIENLLNYAESEIYYPEDYVLLHLTLALVPAFCEEFLFRGLICGRLLPYGKTVAIVGSAVLFGLMHGNLGQLFYTTMAGIMLGWCYAETRSIWPGVLAHMLNNLTGFLSEYWYSALPTGRAWVYDNLLSAAILFAGLGSVVWLLAAVERMWIRLSSALAIPGRCQTGRLPVSLPMSACVRGFFRPTMVIYFVVSLASILAVLGIGLLLGIFSIWGALG